MKKQLIGFSTAVSLFLLLAISVHAQTVRGRINIPFSFIVGEKSFSAGEYLIVSREQDSLNVWKLEGKNGETSFFSTIPVESKQTQEQTKLVFYKYDDQYFLSQVWTTGDNAGRELQVKIPHAEIAENDRRVERVIVVAGN